MRTDVRCSQSLVLLSVLLISEEQRIGLSAGCCAGIYVTWVFKSLAQYMRNLLLECALER